VWLALAGIVAAQEYEIAVYGTTPAGIASAVTAARQGRRVVLLDPTEHFGGLLTGGRSYTDFRTQESVTGFFREYMNRVLTHYETAYGKGSPQVRDCFLGAHAEPHVSERILRAMVGEQKTLTLQLGWRLEAAAGRGFVRSARFRTANGVQTVRAKFWVDATYEGDLAAAAGVPYRTGRESTREYGERFAGVLFFDQGRILPGSTGEADEHIQCYNFRVILTNRAENRIQVPRPARYQREEFTHLIPHFTSGRITEIYTESHAGIFRLQRLPNDKSDMNDIKQAPIRVALPGENNGWPEGDATARQRIHQRHLDYAIGLLYFLQNDSALPAPIREKAREWGLAKDEFSGTGHLPPALYVREARRITGEFTFTEQETQPAPGSVRTALHRDSVAIGDYALNSHGHQPGGPLYPGLVEGDFSFPTTPFQIPYGVMVPRKVENLLVPVAVSASHVGFSALRLEPTWTALGHAAGIAAHLALASGGRARAVPIAELQARLHADGQATIYTSDAGPGSPLFAAIQWAGQHGFLHDIVEYKSAVLEPLRKRHGLQYSYAFPLHAVEPDRPLDGRLRQLWSKRVLCGNAPDASTRGEFLEAMYRQCGGSAKTRSGR
jgi:hypothetical protein